MMNTEITICYSIATSLMLLPTYKFVTNNENKIKVIRLFDIALSIFILLLLSPILFILGLIIYLHDFGPIFYKQERIGYNHKPFFIYKFRSMVIHAEQYGPMLSYNNDPRITPFGKVIRKWRLDELPQFWNVLKGDMSLIGPRAERSFFISQILTLHPEYDKLLKVRPGITSWGIIQFGYAGCVPDMILRSKYDLFYIDNRSLFFNIKILLLTLKTIMEGKGI